MKLERSVYRMSPDELARYLTIDLTTTGRKSRLPRRIEIWWFRVDGHFYITGTGGRRDWLANLRSDPNGIVHVGGRDLPLPPPKSLIPPKGGGCCRTHSCRGIRARNNLTNSLPKLR